MRCAAICCAVAPAKLDRVAVANQLGETALDAFQREEWRAFVVHVEALRRIFRTMTEDEQEILLLPTSVWDALTCWQLPGLTAMPAGLAAIAIIDKSELTETRKERQ